MIFTGQHRRSRQINLGNRQQLNREDALRKAETERQQRLETRRKTEAARRLVAAWRAKKARVEHQRRLRTAYLTSGVSAISLAGIELDFAFLIPSLFELPRDQAAACLKVLVDNQTRFSDTLLVSFCSIWKYRPLQHDLVALTAQSIVSFPPNHTLPFSLFPALAGVLVQENTLPVPLLKTLELVILAHPLQVVKELLKNPLLVEAFTDEMLAPLIKLERLPDLESPINALPLTLRLLKNPQESFPLVALVIDLVPSGELDCEHQFKLAQFCSHELVETLVRILPPMPLAKLFLKLFELVPDSKSDLLLHLTLAATPSPVHSLWEAFQQTKVYANLVSDPKKVYEDEDAWKLLQLAMELYSYWSIIAMDVDMFNSARGFTKEQIGDVATVLRNAVFSTLWNESHIPAKPILFTTLRQLYTKDTRRRFMPENFWLMEKYIDANFSASARHLDSIYFDTNFGLSNALERILQQAPFFIRFRTRAELFVQFTERDKATNTPLGGDLYNREVSEIRREALTEDAERVFAALGPNLRNLRVQLVSNGEPEAGIDGGGLTKEVLMSITDEMFKNPTSARPLFVTNESHLLFPNPINSTPGRESAEALKHYRFLGQVIAKCLYEGVLLDVEFSRFFLQKWAGDTAVKNSFDDLYYLDPELYSSLVALYNYEGNVEELSLDFTTANSGGSSINLRPNGASIAVTNANRLEYIHAIANYRLNTSIASQTRAFLNGMVDLIPLHWLRMFNPHEIQTLISGGTTSVDIDDLERNTIVNGFPANSQTIKNFWKVVREMTPEQQHKLLQFVTSVPKGPLLGFSNLSPKFGIRCATTGPSPVFDFYGNNQDNGVVRDDGRLPTASTCVNLLKLPDYSSIDILREKLLFVIESNAGFDLS